ncbi:MAG TPA: ABC transporter permease subunit [Candidatus Saccharimonadales bacterium]|nr:ABC transporter permease subunit [Candidatus Saccharimonadales bacterium]
MTAAAVGSRRVGTGVRSGSRSRLRPALLGLAFVAVVFLVWEGAKFLGGVPWRELGAQPGAPVLWNPPFRWDFANDLNLPHVWTIVYAFAQPFQRNSETNLAEYLLGASLYTWREAAIGFLLGAGLGLVLATIFVHSRLLERAFVPYVIASQTIPIIALAPMIVFALGQGVFSVVLIATYLTFFPVTIAMIRGLRSFDPRSLELMRSYAATRSDIYWKLRFPASLPFLFTALKIAATASIVGAIIGEDTGGIQEGLGRVITTFNQYYITGPEKLWAAIIAAALLGIVFFACIRVVEIVVLRGRSRPDSD